MKTIKYFAFGSNLSTNQMKYRCPSTTIVGKAILKGRSLAFAGYSMTRNGGVATIIPDPDGRVEGVVYEISEEDLEYLDHCEGYPGFYDRISIDVEIGSDPMETLTYILDRPANLPHDNYIKVILSGYLEHGLDLRLVSECLSKQGYEGYSAFVYGTLKSGEGNHHRLVGVKDMKSASISGTIYDLPYGYPTVTIEGNGKVYGEIYTFHDMTKALESMDMLEGYIPGRNENNLYDRILTMAKDESGVEYLTWTYIAGIRLLEIIPTQGNKIESGIWNKRNSSLIH